MKELLIILKEEHRYMKQVNITLNVIFCQLIIISFSTSDPEINFTAILTGINIIFWIILNVTTRGDHES